MTMNPWMKRSVGTGLAVGGFLLLGVGTAHAEDGGTTPPPDQEILGSVTQLLEGGGALEGLTSTVGTLTGSTTTTYDVPTVSVREHVMPPPKPVKAETMLATQLAAPTTGVTAHSESTTSDADLAAASGPAPDPLASTTDPASAPGATTSSTTTSAPADCDCTITMGTPTVNGTSAGAPGKAQVAADDPVTVAVPVSNTGDLAVTGLTVSGPGGAMACDATTLAVDASTTCSGSYAPNAGEQSAPIYADGSLPDGGDVSSSALLFVTGLAGAAGSAGTSAGTTGGTTPVAGGSPDEDCDCNLTAGTPTVGGKAAGAPGNVEAPTGSAATLSIPVYNSGDKTVTDLSATSPEGPLTCADSELAPTEATACSGQMQPESGDQVVPITVYGVTSEGGSTTTQGTAYVTGVPDGSTPGSTDGADGTDGSTTPTDGSTPGSTDGVDGTDGSTTPTDGSTPTDGTDGSTDGSTPGSTDGADGTDGSTDGSTPTDGTDGTEPLAITDPTVNGKSADGLGKLSAEANRPATMQFRVANTGNDEITDLSGQAGSEEIRCTETDLAPGETATCSARIVPQEGAQSTPIQVSAVTVDGDRTTASRTVALRGVAPAAAAPGATSGGVTSGTPSTVDTGSSVGTSSSVGTGSSAGVAGSGVPGGVILGGVPAPTGLQQVDPSAGAFPMPRGGVGTGGGGMAVDVPVLTHGQDDEGNGLVWLLLIAGAGAVTAQRVRSHRSR